jgi:hypothetical protein
MQKQLTPKFKECDSQGTLSKLLRGFTTRPALPLYSQSKKHEDNISEKLLCMKNLALPK